MKRNSIFLLVLIFAGSLFAQNAVDYVKKWDGRNTLIFEKGNELWDIYVNEYPVTKGTVYKVEYCIEKREYSEKQSTFEGWFIHDEYHLFFDSYKKTSEFMDALTRAYLKDKSILQTEKFIEFSESQFGYYFEENKYYDCESKEKIYRIKLISDNTYSASINVYKTYYGKCESTEYAFVYYDYESNIDYWIDDFDADIFFLQFTNFYTEDFDDEITLHNYFETLSGDFVEAEGMNGTMTVDEYDMNTLYRSFKNDFLYSSFTSILDFLEEEKSSEPVRFLPAIY